MLYAISVLHGYAIEATDGPIGSIRDVLFDDRNWKIRWLVVATGSWLLNREVLLHPTAVIGIDQDQQRISVNLGKVRVEGSPSILHDLPVSRQMEKNLYDYYDWDPRWGGVSAFDAGAMAFPVGMPLFAEDVGHFRVSHALPGAHDDDNPHLRSATETTGYDLHAVDGTIGHVENFLFEDRDWTLRYLIVDTRNWWPGEHVLLSPYAVTAIDWPGHRVDLDVTRDKVRNGPVWDPAAVIDRSYEMGLHQHYGWRGHGW